MRHAKRITVTVDADMYDLLQERKTRDGIPISTQVQRALAADIIDRVADKHYDIDRDESGRIIQSCGTIVQAPAKCVLETHPEWNSCCCICRNLIIDGSHPDTDGGHIMQQRGWICIGFAYQEAEATGFSGWTEHGTCELFDRRPDDAPAPIDPEAVNEPA